MPARIAAARLALLSSAVAAPIGTPTAFLVRDNTAIDPSTTADAGQGVGADGNGWTATLTFKGLAQDSNTNAFNGQQVTIQVTDPGFTTTGAPTTVSRTIKGSVAIRRQWPNNTQRMISVNANGDLVVMFGLDQPIYAGTTIVSVTVSVGAYTGSLSTTIPGSAITNSSTRAYPQAIFGWLNRQRERATGSGFAVEGVAYHRHARNGQQVACVQYLGKDAAGNTTAVQTVSAPALSSIQTKGNIVEAWKATIPLAALNQTTGTTTVANMPFVDAIIYPWIGDSTAITQLSVSGYAVGTTGDPRAMQILYFCNDKGGTYGGAYAYVQAGASGGTVSTTAATARAAPFPTVVAALAAIKTFNGALASAHSDYGGSAVRLMDNAGAAQTHQIAASPANSPGITYCSIEPDPSNTGVVSLQVNTSSNMIFPTMTSFGAVTLLPQAGTSGYEYILSPSSYTYMAFEGTTINFTGSTHPITYNIAAQNLYLTMRNVTVVSNAGGCAGATGRQFYPLILGCTGITSTIATQMVVGNTLSGVVMGEGSSTSASIAQPGCDGAIIANNTILSLTQTTAASLWGYNFVYTKGLALVQNVVEQVGNGSTAIFNIAADGSKMAVDNMLDVHNTIVGNRGNRMYCDNAGSIGQRKRGMKRYCLDYSWPMKADCFGTNNGVAQASDSTGRVSNWEYLYDVDNFGNCTLAGAATENGTIGPFETDPQPDGLSWQGMWVQPTSTKHLVTQNGRTTPSAYASLVGFTADNSYFGANTGGGTYTLTGSSNAAYNRVPSGQACLKYDLAGIARRNDGTGAAGAYERTV